MAVGSKGLCKSDYLKRGVSERMRQLLATPASITNLISARRTELSRNVSQPPGEATLMSARLHPAAVAPPSPPRSGQMSRGGERGMGNLRVA